VDKGGLSKLINLTNGMTADGGLKMKEDNNVDLRLKNTWEVVCKGSDGKEKWRELNDNLIVTVGLNDLLDKYFKGSSYTAAWYIGLKGTGTALAADTMSSHSSWAVDANYSESVRQTLTLGTPSAGSVSNSASKATFSINATTTIYGAFLTSSNTKSGTAGTLYGVVDFGSSRAVISGDTLEITVTLTAASA
jgi:hypothetical protein